MPNSAGYNEQSSGDVTRARFGRDIGTEPGNHAFGPRLGASAESAAYESDDEVTRPALPAAGCNGFVDIAVPLAGRMAFEIVRAAFGPYRDVEAAYRDLKESFLRYDGFDSQDWETTLLNVQSFCSTHGWLLPDAMQSGVRTALSALEQLRQLWRVYESLQGIIAKGDLSWWEKPGLLWSVVEQNGMVSALIPEHIKHSINRALEWQKQFMEHYGALEELKSKISEACASLSNGSNSREAASVALTAIGSLLDRSTTRLPAALHDYLGVPPDSVSSLRTYVRKVERLWGRFERVIDIPSIDQALKLMDGLVSDGLFELAGGQTAPAPHDRTLPSIDAWLAHFGRFRVALAGLFLADSKDSALKRVQALLQEPLMNSLLDAQLLESLDVCAWTFSRIASSYDGARGIHSRLVALYHSEEPLRRKLAQIKHLIETDTLTSTAFRRLLGDVSPTLDTVSSCLAMGSMDTDTGALDGVGRAFAALDALVDSPPLRQLLGREANQQAARLIESVRQGVSTVRHIVKVCEGGSSFGDFLNGILSPQGRGALLGDILAPVFEVASTITLPRDIGIDAHMLVSAETMAERLNILMKLLSDQTVADLIMQCVPEKHRKPFRAASLVYQSLKSFPAAGSDQSRLTWLREHMPDADVWRTLIGEKYCSQWSDLVLSSDPVLVLVKRLLPLINARSTSVSEIYSALSLRATLQVTQQGLSAALYHVSDPCLLGIGTVAGAGLGVAVDLASDDPLSRRRAMDALTRALESTLRRGVARYIGVTNPAAAVVSDVVYSILVKPVAERLPDAYARNVTEEDWQSRRAIGAALMKTLKSACPSKAQFLESIGKYTQTSPLVASYVRLASFIIDELATHMWTMHLAFDVYLLMHADASVRADRVSSLRRTLETMGELDQAWVRPFAGLIPLIPDLLEARRQLSRDLPVAGSWLEWGAELSALLAGSEDPSVVRLREALASRMAAFLIEGFNRLLSPEQPDAGSRTNAPMSPSTVTRTVQAYAWSALGQKAGAATAIWMKRWSNPAAWMSYLKCMRGRSGTAQRNPVPLSQWADWRAYVHHGVTFSESERQNIPDGAGGFAETYEKLSRRYILVGDKVFSIEWDSSVRVYRLGGRSDTCGMLQPRGPAIIFHGGQWFVTTLHHGRGGARDYDGAFSGGTTVASTSANTFDTAENEQDDQDASLLELQSLLDRIVAGAYPDVDVEALQALPDFQLTQELYKALLEPSAGSSVRWTGAGVGLGLGVLGALALVYSLYTSRPPFLHVATSDEEADSEDTAKRGGRVKIPQVLGVALLASGTLVALHFAHEYWVQKRDDRPSDDDQYDAPEVSLIQGEAHGLRERSAVAASGQAGSRSRLAQALDVQAAYAVNAPIVGIQLGLDVPLCIYAGDAYYICVDARYWKIDRPLGYERTDPRVGDPSIRFAATLQLKNNHSFDVVYSEPLGWRLKEVWMGRVCAEATPQSPLNYIEHEPHAAAGKDRSHLFLELLKDAVPDPSHPSPTRAVRPKSGKLPRRLFVDQEGTARQHFIWVKQTAYLPIDWWWVDGHKPRPRERKIIAAGMVTYRARGRSDSLSMLIVYDDFREWTPAYFSAGQVHIFGAAASLNSFSSRYSAEVEPLPLPAKNGIVNRIVESRFTARDAHTPLSDGSMTATLEAPIWRDRSGSFYFKCASGYWLMDWHSVGMASSVFSGPGITHFGHIKYKIGGAEQMLYVVYSKRLGLLPSIVDRDGKVLGMMAQSDAVDSRASEPLLNLVQKFEKFRAFEYADQADGRDGAIYFDYLGDISKRYMFFDRFFWEFEWIAPDRGVLHASWSDGTPCDVVMSIRRGTWSLGWDVESAPQWFEAYMKIVLAKGELGQMLVHAAEHKLSKDPVSSASSMVQDMARVLNTLEQKYRREVASERWTSVVVLSAQLLAFFSDGTGSDQLRNFGFSDEIYRRLGRIYPARVIEDEVDESIMNEILDTNDPIDSLDRIAKELKQVNDEMAFVVAEKVKAEDIRTQADKVLGHRQGEVSPGYADLSPLGQFHEDLDLGFRRLVDWCIKTNDSTHILAWVNRYITWLSRRHKDLDDRRNALQDRRNLIRSHDQYKETFKSYVGGLATGKMLERKFRGALSDVRAPRESKLHVRVLRASFFGAMAELATRSQSLPGPFEVGDALAATQYYLLNRLRAQSRYYELIEAVGEEIWKKKIRVTGTYLDVMDSLAAATDIEHGTNELIFEFVNADTSILAAMVYEVSTTPKTLADLEADFYDELLKNFKSKSRLLHPFSIFPKKPKNYKSLYQIMPASMMDENKDRYAEYDAQFQNYKDNDIRYDAGIVVRSALESALIGYRNMYEVQEIINLDFSELGARVHFIKLADGTWLFYVFLREDAGENAREQLYNKEHVGILQRLRTGMKWIHGDPGACASHAACDDILTFMQGFYVRASKHLEAGTPKRFFGRVVTYFGLGNDGEHDQLWNMLPDPAAAGPNAQIGTELLPYLLNETEKDLKGLVDQLKTSMFELTLNDKLIGFFVPFYSEIRKQALDENYSVDPISMIVDAISVALTAIPGGHSIRMTVKDIGAKSLWQFGKNTGLTGRFLISHVASQIPGKTAFKLSRELATMAYELFNPFSFPFNPLTLNFRGLIQKGRIAVHRRGLVEFFSDAHLVKSYLDDMFLPVDLKVIRPQAPLPGKLPWQVGPDLFCQTSGIRVTESEKSIYFIKSGSLFYVVELNPDQNHFALQQTSGGLPLGLRRRFADWVENTVSVPIGSSVEPARVGVGLDIDPVRVRGLMHSLRAARSEATVMLKLARRVAASEQESERVKQAFEIFWGASDESSINSVGANLNNILDYLDEVSVVNDVAYLAQAEGPVLSALPGSAFDLRQTYDICSTVRGEDLESGSNQFLKSITGPGFLHGSYDMKGDRYMVRQAIIPMVMRDDRFDASNYDLFVTAYLVRLNHLSRCLIREGFVATTRSKRVDRKWKLIMNEFRATLAKVPAADKQKFLIELSRKYGIFLHKDEPVAAEKAAAFASNLGDFLDAHGNDVGLDVSPLLRSVHGTIVEPGVDFAGVDAVEANDAARSMAANPDNFSFLVCLLADSHADPVRFDHFVRNFKAWKLRHGVGALRWKWFE